MGITTGGVIIRKEVNSLNEHFRVLTVKDVAAILQISRAKAYELVHSKGFPTKHIGRRLRIPRELFFNWLNNLDSTENSESPGISMVSNKT
jgi:excisionase family DNA binding protein